MMFDYFEMYFGRENLEQNVAINYSWICSSEMFDKIYYVPLSFYP